MKKLMIKICMYTLMAGVLGSISGCSLRSHRRENAQAPNAVQEPNDAHEQEDEQESNDVQEQSTDMPKTDVNIEYDFGDEIVEYSCSYLDVSPDKILQDFIKEPLDELELEVVEDEEFLIKYYTGKERTYDVVYNKDKKTFSLRREDKKSKNTKKTDISDVDRLANEYIKKLGYDVTLEKEKVDQVSEYDVKITYGFSKDGNYIVGNRIYEPYFVSGWAVVEVINGEVVYCFITSVPGELVEEKVIKRTELINDDELLNSITSSDKYAFFSEISTINKVSLAYQPERKDNGKVLLKPLFHVFLNNNEEIMNDAMLIDPESGIVLD